MASSFTFEPVADDIAIGGEVSLTLDGDGKPAIVFSDGTSGQVFVARRDTGSWKVESVTGAFTGNQSRARLAIDSNGNPQVAYHDTASTELVHALKSGGRWSLTHIPTRLNTGHGPNAVSTLDFALHPGRLDTQSRDVGYFVYSDSATNGIGFAHTGSLGPTPIAVEIPNDNSSFGGPSAAFDSSENFFIACVGVFHGGAPRDSFSIRQTHIVDIEKGTLATPTVIEASQLIDVTSGTSVARSGFGGCLAYLDMASKTLKASVSSGASSSIEIVATGVDKNDTPSAAVKRGEFRVAYAASGGIKLASRSNSGNWTSEIVTAASGGSPSLAYDNSGTPNIAYAVGSRLMYASRSE